MSTLQRRRDMLVFGDGGLARLRSMNADDRDGLREAATHLSPRSSYQRWFAPKPRLTDRELTYLTDLDHHAREALIALAPSGSDWLAVARYAAALDDPLAVEVAVTVADEWQGRGLGSALTNALVERAREEGFRRVRAFSLADNPAALTLIRRAGFRRVSSSGGVLEFVLELR